MRLFHFSEDPRIELFAPRPVRTPVERPDGQDWLNGPLVWAIDEAHEHLYLFPRECPRILVWAKPTSLEADRLRWLGDTAARAVAFVERDWLERLSRAVVYRYETPVEGFEDLGDVGMWVSRLPVRPLRVEALDDLPAQLARRGVELRVLDSLLPLKPVWQSSLHASGIRLRNAAGWGAPGWPHSSSDAAAGHGG
jgi:hypothetical protein